VDLVNLAFPFTSSGEEGLWKEETWKIELLADSIDPMILVLGIALLSSHTYIMKLKYPLHLNSLSASSNASI